jgi:lipoprotein-anchoring transpeptidase ErfK/SrfK
MRRRPIRRWLGLGPAALLLAVVASSTLSAQAEEVWMLVDTKARTLSVFQGASVLRVYENIAIGRGGAAPDRIKDDAKTPLGEYRIARIKEKTPFHRFYGFDYPTPEHALRALRAGVIDQRQFGSVIAAVRRGEAPPQETPLGGYLGIHGVGAGDPRIHQNFNWTNGCIALSNEQIDDMARWMEIGTRVVVE